MANLRQKKGAAAEATPPAAPVAPPVAGGFGVKAPTPVAEALAANVPPPSQVTEAAVQKGFGVQSGFGAAPAFGAPSPAVPAKSEPAPKAEKIDFTPVLHRIDILSDYLAKVLKVSLEEVNAKIQELTDALSKISTSPAAPAEIQVPESLMRHIRDALDTVVGDMPFTAAAGDIQFMGTCQSLWQGAGMTGEFTTDILKTIFLREGQFDPKTEMIIPKR